MGNIYKMEEISHSRICSLDKDKTLVVASFSPIEVHGPHLPLGQDLMEAYAIAQAVGEKLQGSLSDWDFLLLHPIPLATDCVPKLGSIDYPVNLVSDVAFHTLEPLAKAGFKKLIFSSFHGGPRHVCALEKAAEKISKKYQVDTASLFSIVLSRLIEGNAIYDGVKDNPDCKIDVEQLKQDHHAGFLETSLGLHLWPELVDENWKNLPESTARETIEDDKNDSFLYGYNEKTSLLDEGKRAIATVESIYRSLKHFKENTYFGYPSLASESQGKDLLEHLSGIAEEAMLEFISKGVQMGVHSPLWKMQKVLMNPALNKVYNSYMK